jgi:hypothetical protein
LANRVIPKTWGTAAQICEGSIVSPWKQWYVWLQIKDRAHLVLFLFPPLLRVLKSMAFQVAFVRKRAHNL